MTTSDQHSQPPTNPTNSAPESSTGPNYPIVTVYDHHLNRIAGPAPSNDPAFDELWDRFRPVAATALGAIYCTACGRPHPAAEPCLRPAGVSCGT